MGFREGGAVRPRRSCAGGVSLAYPRRAPRQLGLPRHAGPTHEPVVRHPPVRRRGVPPRPRRPHGVAARALARPLRSGAALRQPLQCVRAAVEHAASDRGSSPHSGSGSRALPKWGTRVASAAAGAASSHHVADLRGSLPLVRRVSLWAGATVGASGGEPPPYYQFFLGGANAYYLFPYRDIAFVGLRTQQRRGRHVQKAELGVQWELGPDVFARVRWNAGTVLDRWSFDPASYVDGMGVELGAKTFAGRLSISASGNAHTSWPMIEIDLGYPF